MANADKSHLFLSSNEDYLIETKEFTIKSSHCEKIQGLHFDDQQ